MSEVAHTPQLRFPEFSDNWEEKKLGNVTSIVMGQSPDSTSYNSNGIGLYLIQGNADIKKRKTLPRVWTDTPTKECKVGDIIMTVRAPVGAVAKSIHNACIGRGVCAIRNNQHSVSNYIYQFLLSFEKKWVKFEQGSTFTAVNTKDVKSLKLILPPVQEQTKIAAFLTAVDNKIEQLSKKQALLGSWKKGVMLQIFSQEIRFKADDGSDFPDWEEKNIVELAKTSIGLVTSMTPYYVDKGVPLIRNNDIFQNKIRKEKLIRLDYEFDQLNKNRRLFTNDIVTVHTGNIGASAVIDEELNGCQGFATLNTRIKNQNEISSSFLCWYYNSTRNIKYALSMATGDGRSNYNLKDFNKATIPVPSLPEQTKIAAFLTAADNKIEQVGKQFDESKQFKKALLQQMFV